MWKSQAFLLALTISISLHAQTFVADGPKYLDKTVGQISDLNVRADNRLIERSDMYELADPGKFERGKKTDDLLLIYADSITSITHSFLMTKSGDSLKCSEYFVNITDKSLYSNYLRKILERCRVETKDHAVQIFHGDKYFWNFIGFEGNSGGQISCSKGNSR